VAVFAALLCGAASVALGPAGPAAAVGSAVLSVTITPVDSLSGATQTTAQIGTHQNSVAYRVNYACATAACTGATVHLSAPQTDPNGLVPATPTPNTLLSYASWTPPAAGGSIAGNDAAGMTATLGNLNAGDSGNFLVVYAIPTQIGNSLVSPAQFYPDGFQIQMSATIDSASATGPRTADAAAVTWHNQLPSPVVTQTNPGNQPPNVNVTSFVAMTTGVFTPTGGSQISGDATDVAAGSYTLTDQLPPQATLVSVKLDNGVTDPLANYDAATNTITWTVGSAADPDYNAAGGWGWSSTGSWAKIRPYLANRVITVTYPGTAFADADPSGCNFSDTVTNTLTGSVTYLDSAHTTVAFPTSSQNYTVACSTPFAQAENGGKDSSSVGTEPDGTTRDVDVAPDVTGLSCPSSGHDDWGRLCTPGAAVAPVSVGIDRWVVTAYNESNRPAVAVVTDNDLSQGGTKVTEIQNSGGSATVNDVQYTLNDGTTGDSASGSNAKVTISGSPASGIILDTAPGLWLTAATVTSNPIPPAVQTGSNPTKIRTSFVAGFFYTVTPGTPAGTTTTNTASMSISWPTEPSLPQPGDPMDLGSASRAIKVNDLPVEPIFTATQPSAPVVAGGGNPVSGTNVTFSLSGTAQTAIGGNPAQILGPALPADVDITPQYVFIAPPNWTIPQATPPTFTGGTVPGGVSFHYGTVTIAGQPRQAVVASWPDTASFGEDGNPWPTMHVIAQPTSAAGGTSGAATMWIGDSRDTYTNTTATFVNGVQNTVDANGDGNTAEWLSAVTSSSVAVSGVAALSVQKSICQPDPAQPDGCDWISTPGSVVGVAVDATAILYRITITNNGTAPVTNAAAYDVLPYIGDTGTSQATADTPRGSTFDETLTAVSDVDPGMALAYSTSTNPCRPEVYPSAPGCVDDWGATAAGASSIRATVATLAGGASASFTYDAGVAAGAPADALGCNSVAVASDQTIAAEPQAVCASTEQADLQITTPARLPLQAGRPGVVTFTVVNHGGSAQAPATVTIDVPAGLSVTDLTPTGYACSDTADDTAPIAGPVTLTCVAQNPDGSARSLAKETPETLTLPVLVDDAATGSACLDATVSGPLPDPDTANNATTGCYTIAAGPAAGLEVTKDDGVAAVTVGAQSTYTITVANPLVGEPVTGTTLTDTLPAGEQFISATAGGTASGQTVTWTLPTLGPAGAPSAGGDDVNGGTNATVTLSVTVRVLDTAISTVTNPATATAPDPGDASATLTGQDADTDTVTNVFLDANPSLTTPQNHPITTALADIVTTQGAPLDPTALTQATAPAHGSITIDSATGAVTYSPAAGYSGPDSYQVQACDTSSPAQCHTATVQITVGVNVVTALDETATTTAATPVSTDVRANDTSASGQPLANPTVSTPPSHGSASVNATTGTITYTPAAQFSGTDSYGYTVCDTSTPTTVCDTATVTVTVNNVFTDGPAADGNAGIQTAQNAPIQTPLSEIVSVTGAPLDPTSVTQTTAPVHGQIAIDSATGAVTYTPAPGYTGPDSYTVTVCDTATPDPQCHLTTVAVTVLPNTVLAQDQTISTRIDTPSAPIDVLTSATSASGQPLNNPTIATDPTHGNATVNPDGTITYTPADGYVGGDLFTYTICDTGDPDQACDTATITVTVTPVADLATTKTLDTATVVAGRPITYTTTITNHGPSAATGVHSIDPITATITQPSGAPDPSITDASCVTRSSTADDLAKLNPANGPYTLTGYPLVVDCIYPSLPAGTSVHDTITGTVTPATRAGRTVLNQAAVYSDTYDPDLSNNLAAVTAEVTTSADLAVTKTAKTTKVSVGEQDSFTVTVTNHGPSDALGVTIKDTPTGMSVVSASPSQGSFDTATGVWTVGALASGQTATLTVVEKSTAIGASNTAAVEHSDTPDPQDSNNSATAALTVTTPTTPPASTDNGHGTDLASTGSDVARLGGIAFVLLLTGTGALLLGRRRRRA
jgi:uncharacterized repeat protein (TIGR01451 family)